MKSNKTLFLLKVIYILTLCVNSSLSKQSRDHIECERYCHMNCDDIPDQHHRDQCKAVHSHHSDCNCHFGGATFGIFVALGLVAILIFLCCVCRHCKTSEGGGETRIVVVTQPQTVTTISHPGGEIHHTNYSQSPQHHVYSIEMQPQQQTTSKQDHFTNDEDGATAVTVITSRNMDSNSESKNQNARVRSLSSERVYFESNESEAATSDDLVFLPPRY